MLIKQGAGLRLLNSIKNSCTAFFLFLFMGFFCYSNSLHGVSHTEPTTVTYYLSIFDFADSFIQIPTSNVSGDSLTTNSSYLAGRAPIYDANNVKVGTCSASFLNMENEDGIFTDISNSLSAVGGLVVTWFTPSKLANLELDSIINSMVTECIVVQTTKIGVDPFYGQTFNLIVSSDDEKVYFQFVRTGTIY